MSGARVKPEDRFAALLDLTEPTTEVDEAELRAMLRIADALITAGPSAATTPDASFRGALRQRLVAVATVQHVGNEAETDRRRAPARRRGMRWRATAFAGTFAVATATAGVGIAAAHSLPGSPFYGVKRASEAVQLWTARGDLAKGKRHLEFARTRLKEAGELPKGSSHVSATLAAMNSETTAGSAELMSAYQSSRSTEPLADLVVFSQQQISGLDELAPRLLPAARTQDLLSVKLLAGVVHQIHLTAKGVCVACLAKGGLPSTVTPPVLPTPSTGPSKHPRTHSSTARKTGSSGPTKTSGQGSGQGSGGPAPSKGKPTPAPKASSTSAPNPLPTLPIPLPTLSLPITLPPLLATGAAGTGTGTPSGVGGVTAILRALDL